MDALKREFKKLGSLALFFLICFSYILLLIKLFVEEYSIDVYVLSKAIVGALLAAKAVLIMNATRHIRRFQEATLYVVVLYKTSIYTIAVLILGALEGIFEKYHKTRSLAVSIREFFYSKNFSHVLAITLCVAVVFLIYNILNEIDIYIGKGKLLRLFFTKDKDN